MAKSDLAIFDVTPVGQAVALCGLPAGAISDAWFRRWRHTHAEHRGAFSGRAGLVGDDRGRGTDGHPAMAMTSPIVHCFLQGPLPLARRGSMQAPRRFFKIRDPPAKSSISLQSQACHFLGCHHVQTRPEPPRQHSSHCVPRPLLLSVLHQPHANQYSPRRSCFTLRLTGSTASSPFRLPPTDLRSGCGFANLQALPCPLP